MGPTGAPTEIPEKPEGPPRRRRPRQRRALFDRQGDGEAATGYLFRRLRSGKTCSSVRKSRRRPTRSSGAPISAPPSSPSGRRTRTSAATSSRRCSLTTGQLGDRGRSAGDRRPDHRHRLGPDDGRGARRRGTVSCGPHLAEPRRHRQHQLADAVHDERSLRAVPAAARRSRNRERDDHLSCFNQDQEMDRVDFAEPAARLRQNTVQEKLSNRGSITCWMARRLTHG